MNKQTEITNSLPVAHLSVRKRGSKATLEIFGDIGPASMGMIDANSVSMALRKAKDVSELTVRIDSRGGVGHLGLAIHNLIKSHPAKVTVRVEGIAGSAASLIAMAGDTVQMPPNTMMMIHNPAIVAFGGESELKKALRVIETTRQAAVVTYAAKTKLSSDRISELMDDETWMTASEAVELGFADEVIGDEVEIDSQDSPTLFALNNIPEQLTGLLKSEPLLMEFSKMADEPIKTDPKTKTDPEMKTDPVQKTDPPVKTDPPAKTKPPKTEETSLTAQEEAHLAVKTDRKRMSDIRSLCNQAQMPKLSDHFCFSTEPEYSVEDVRVQLFAKMCKDNAVPGDTGEESNSDDPDAKFKAEFQKSKAQLSCSEDEYVQTRRIDEGLDTLVAGSATK